MRTFTDQMGRMVEVSESPCRIISIVPSQTELLADFGLENEVIGITKFCVHPDKWFKSKTRVGGTKKLDIEKIKILNPDLIIGNKEENSREDIESLSELFPVWMSDIKNLDDAQVMTHSLGMLTGRENQAKSISGKINSGFNNLAQQTTNKFGKPLRVAYFIWRNPFMLAGGNTFINDMLRKSGMENIFENHEQRYPETNEEELVKLNPDVILLSSEPYPFKEKHIEEFNRILPGSKVVLVDGEIFSWYGSRLMYAPDYFQALVNII